MVVAAYVAAALGAAGGRLVDRSLDQGLTALTGAVTRRLGRRALDDLDRNPASMAARRRLADEIERAASADAEIARELAELRDRLDRMNGPTIINTATHGSRIVTGGDGMTAGDDVLLTAGHGRQSGYVRRPRPTLMRQCVRPCYVGPRGRRRSSSDNAFEVGVMKSVFRMGIVAVAVGIGSVVIAGPAQADVWRDAVCGHGYHYGQKVDIHGQQWKIEGERGNGAGYILSDKYGRTNQVDCS
ncbi:hypothetical protein [Nocardia araoensis]|uniref:hypothetical protein n=2 Tax=Nocardia TaxID=1817 RepID=UPI0002DF4D82|nr:hypothetical protein [Nocardia araoensis]